MENEMERATVIYIRYEPSFPDTVGNLSPEPLHGSGGSTIEHYLLMCVDFSHAEVAIPTVSRQSSE